MNLKMRNDKKNVIVELTFDFSIKSVLFCELLELERKFVIARQLLKSSTSIGANIREAQNAESKNDFIHKMKISLRELRETFNCLKIIRKKNWYSDEKLLPILDENNQLISIFVKCIETAKINNTSR